MVTAGLHGADVERLAAAGFGATEVMGPDGPTSPPSVYLHCFSRDGILRWLWTEPGSVPAGVPPVTEPAKSIADVRHSYGWAADQPVYGCDSGTLRLWTANDHWFLDNRLVHMDDIPATFVWSFGTLDEAIAGAWRFYAAVRYLENRGMAWPSR